MSWQIEQLDHAFDEADEDHRLRLYADAVNFIVLGLGSCPGLSAQGRIFHDLALQLEAMARGAKALKPIKSPKGGRPRSSPRDEIIHGRAAAAVHYAEIHGQGEQTTKMLARALTEAGVRGRQGKAISEPTLREWLREVRDTRGRKEEARVTYLVCLADLGNFAPERRMSPPQLRRFLCDFALAAKVSEGKFLTNPYLSQ